MGLNRRKLNVPRREWSSPLPHRDLWTGRNGTPSLTGFMLIFSSYKVIWPDVSDAPSELATLLHNRGRCSRNQRVPQQTGSMKLQVELLTLFFFSPENAFFFPSQSQVLPRPNITHHRSTQPARVSLFFTSTSTFYSNTAEQRNYLDVVCLFTGAGTKEPLRREWGAQIAWRSSTLWVKHLLMCQQGTLNAHFPHLHCAPLLIPYDRL